MDILSRSRLFAAFCLLSDFSTFFPEYEIAAQRFGKKISEKLFNLAAENVQTALRAQKMKSQASSAFALLSDDES
jgi:hypothetical protein